MAETFEELIGRHLDDLYSAALCFTGDEHTAEQLLQQAAIRGFHEFASRDRGLDFHVWMLGRLVHAYRERERRRARDPLAGAVQMEVGSVLESGPDPVSLPTTGSPEYRALGTWLHRAWGDLDAGDRLVLWLADIARLRHAQIAAMLEIEVETVRRRHYRARGSLVAQARRRIERAAGEAPR